MKKNILPGSYPPVMTGEIGELQRLVMVARGESPPLSKQSKIELLSFFLMVTMVITMFILDKSEVKK